MNRLFRFSTLAFWVLSVVTVGCGSDAGGTANAAAGSPGTSLGQGGNVSTSGGSGGLGNASGGNAGVGGSTGASSAATLRTGQFLLYSIVMSQQNVAYQVSASFSTASSQSCAQTFGACKYYSNCVQSANNVSAGTLTVTSPATATLAANNITMVPNADNTYDNAALSGAFSGAEAAHLAASGATVPAFSADLTVPLALLIDSPTPDASGTIKASSSSDLVISFSRAAAGVVLQAQTSYTGGAEWLECYSAAGASSLTIPKAALAVASGGSLILYTSALKEITAGDFTVSTGVIMNAYTTDKLHPVVVQVQ